MEVKDILIRKAAVKSNVGEEIVRDIVSFQWRSCLQAIKSDATSIEVSELGIFKFHEKKALLKLEDMKESIEFWKTDPEKYGLFIEDYEEKIKLINSKLQCG